VCGRVFEHFYLIECSADDFAFSDNDSPNRHLFVLERFSGKPERFTHEIRVVGKMDQIFHENFA
jgi:hypothetical protein